MTHREDLDRRMHNVLIQLAVCSHVPAAGWNLTSAGSDEPLGGNRPPGDKGNLYFARAYGPPFLTPTPRWPGASDDADRARVLDEALDELEHIRGHTERPKPKEEKLPDRNKRIIAEGEGFTAQEVAIRFRCGVRDILTARRAADRDSELGKPIARETPPDIAARRVRARDLRDNRRMPLSSIAQILGVDKATVVRDLKEEAA